MPPKKSRGGRKKGARKKETKKDSNTTPMKWCYPGCMLDGIEAESMIQCHICQLWAHVLCINEGENDIVGIWCCRNCRKLPETTEMLCNKIDDPQRDMAVLLKFVHSFRHTVPTVTVLDNDLSDDGSDSHDQTISLIGTPPTSIVMPTNNPVVDRQPPENNNTETENNNSPPIVSSYNMCLFVFMCMYVYICNGFFSFNCVYRWSRIKTGYLHFSNCSGESKNFRIWLFFILFFLFHNIM